MNIGQCLPLRKLEVPRGRAGHFHSLGFLVPTQRLARASHSASVE